MMDSETAGLMMDALSAAIYLPWYRVDSFLSPNTEEVFYLTVSQSVPSGISCSEAGCIDQHLSPKTSSCCCFNAVDLDFVLISDDQGHHSPNAT